MPNKKITVTVSGPNHSGKTHVIAAIHTMLVEQGLGDKVTITGVDDSAQAYGAIQNNIKELTLSNIIPSLEVEVIEYYGDAPTSKEFPKNQRVPLVPILRPETEHLFVDQKEFPPRQDVVYGEQVNTSYLKFGNCFDILDLSTNDLMRETGADTGTIDPAIALNCIVMQVGSKSIVAGVSRMPTAYAVMAQHWDYKTWTLNFQQKLMMSNEEYVEVNVKGTINLENGLTEINAEVLNTNLPGDQKCSLIGFDFLMYRTNANRR